MGQDVIVGKLNRELAEPITSERQVVYILVETRKLLELAGMLDAYPQLVFFCNWAMHTTLDRPAARRMIEPFDVTIAATRRAPPNPTDLAANPEAMQEFVGQIVASFDVAGLRVFKEELERFFQSQLIDCPLLGDEGGWINFLRYYLGVIEDCPLKCQGNANVKTLLVRRVAADSYSDDAPVYLRLRWIWLHEDGTETTIVDSTLGSQR